MNDGIEVFALSHQLTWAFTDAGCSEPEEPASRWTARLRCAGGDDMTADDLLAVLRGVARLAASGAHGWWLLPLEILTLQFNLFGQRSRRLLGRQPG